jgi:hypothetical protein
MSVNSPVSIVYLLHLYTSMQWAMLSRGFATSWCLTTMAKLLSFVFVGNAPKDSFEGSAKGVLRQYLWFQFILKILPWRSRCSPSGGSLCFLSVLASCVTINYSKHQLVLCNISSYLWFGPQFWDFAVLAKRLWSWELESHAISNTNGKLTIEFFRRTEEICFKSIMYLTFPGLSSLEAA